MASIKNRRYWGAGFPVFLFIPVFLIAGCDISDILDNSPMDYIEENLAVKAIGWEGRSVSNSSVPVQRPDGVIAIPPGNSVIAVKLHNIRGLTVTPGLENTGSMGVWTAEQENTSTILIKISIPFTAHGTIYKPTLTMKGPGGQEFIPYTLPELRCYYFNTDLSTLSITRWDGGSFSYLTLSPDPFSPAVTEYTAVVELPLPDSVRLWWIPLIGSGSYTEVATLNGTGVLPSYSDNILSLLNVGNNSLNIRVRADNGVTYKDYHVNLIKETAIKITGVVKLLPVIDFNTSSPPSIASGIPVSITLSSVSAPSSWHIELNGPQTVVFTTADDIGNNPLGFTFSTSGLGPGFYTVNVIATITIGVIPLPYSGSFSLIVN